MEKNNIVRLIIASIICLLPICLSVMMYNDLPERLVMQWNIEGNPNWDAPKAVLAFGVPLFLMVLNIAVNILVYNLPNRKNVSTAMQLFLNWFIPVLSLIFVPLALLINLGAELPIKMIAFIFIGLVFIFIGNYLPKNRQNVIAGIRISWTLNNTENWNKTHRLAGVLWIIGGILFIVLAFLPLENIAGLIIIFTILLLIMIIVPILYSYFLHRREEK
jgi:uncharacterized membrane protein